MPNNKERSLLKQKLFFSFLARLMTAVSLPCDGRWWWPVPWQRN